MNLRENMKAIEQVLLGAAFKVPALREMLNLRRAEVTVVHRRGDVVLSKETRFNLIIDAGRRQYHKQCFGTSGLGTNGFNYIALSNDTVGETATSTTLSNEIAANGLSRAQGAVVLPTGSGNITTVDKTFTCATAPQAAQKAALFDASSSGNMNHVLGFTARSLQIGDTLDVTFSITLG
jgi:hypothetical protein